VLDREPVQNSLASSRRHPPISHRRDLDHHHSQSEVEVFAKSAARNRVLQVDVPRRNHSRIAVNLLPAAHPLKSLLLENRRSFTCTAAGSNLRVMGRNIRFLKSDLEPFRSRFKQEVEDGTTT
jgi:hypothetical protein